MIAVLFIAGAFLAYDASRNTYSFYDVRITRYVQTWTAAWLDPVISFFNELTNMYPAIAIWTGSFILFSILGLRVEAFTILLAALAFFGMETLGNFVARPRPSPELVHVSQKLIGNSFPSGHVFGAVVYYGLLVGFSWQRIRWAPIKLLLAAGAAFITGIAGFARIYLGVHWASDVLGGLLLGSTALAVLLWVYTGLKAGYLELLGLQFRVSEPRRAKIIDKQVQPWRGDVSSERI
jgi:undecaprenyl-diphosphatase